MAMRNAGAWTLACVLVLTNGDLLRANGGDNTNIYTVFLNQGCSCPAGGTPEGLITNEEVLRELQAKCTGVDFIARDITKRDTNIGAVRDELEASKEHLDGVLILGALGNRDYRLAFTGLPTICVYNLFEWMNIPYKLYDTGKEDSIKVGGPEYKGGKILTAQLDRRNVCAPSASSAMFEDLVNKIKIIQAIKRLKGTRILVVTPNKYLAQVDYQGDANKRFPEDYNQRYTRALKESLGVELVRIEPEEFYEAVRKVEQAEADQIAQMWIDEAQGVKDTTKLEVVKTAKSYLAFEALRRKYSCNAVSTQMRSLTGSGKVEDIFWPGLGLMEFQKRGIQAICQEYENIMVAHLLAYYLTGRPSMLGDLMIDTFNNITLLTHCGAPINPYGDDRRIPYIIWSHAQSPVRGTLRPGSGTGAQVNYPAGEPVTIWKVYVLHRKIGLHTGTTADGHSFYKDFDAIMCRTKLVVKVDDAGKIQKHFSPDEYGIHRAGTLGDLREMIKDLAILIGYDVIEEDK
jgi:hypothetical protein